MAVRHDSLYAQPIETITEFRFDHNVAAIFDDMIKRSVPGYQTIISSIGPLAERYAQNDSLCYDLGCSLGTAAISMAATINKNNCRIIAVDNSPAMISGCQKILKSVKFPVSIHPICADVRHIEISRASVVVLNYTLQFIPPQHRLKFLGKIHDGLLPGGILILSEKLRFKDPQQQALHDEMHHAFKKCQGYSELEISQKRTALEKILIPDTLLLHRNRLKKAGFDSIEVWFQYFNFVSLIAIKRLSG